jgi:hypothetical protein
MLQSTRYLDERDASLRNSSVEAEVVNVSKGGISVECGKRLEKGLVYTVRLFWCGTVFDAKCEAVWTLSDGSGQRYRSGMKFVLIDRNKVDDFMACLEQHVSDASKRLHPRMRTTGTRALVSHP